MSKRYRDGLRGERTAVHQVTLSLEEGSCTLLLGASGAGKSTLLALGAGVLLPTEGEVQLSGEPLSRWRDRFRASARRTRIGYVPQQLALLPGFSCIENLLLSTLPQEFPPAEQRHRALEMLERFGIKALAHAAVHTLSSGEKQRVSLCRAMLQNASILLLDEPSANLDEQSLQTLVALSNEHQSKGGAILLATHDPRLRSAQFSSPPRVLQMNNGELQPISQ